MSMLSELFLLPGEKVASDRLPKAINSSATLKLGPGLVHTPPSTITTNLSGPLYTDQKKNAIWIEHNNGRYIPHTSDLIIAIVHHSAADYYHCTITPHTSQALLPHLAFEGATKKTRPQLASGALVYARVDKADAYSEVEILCYNPSTGKSEGMGELKDGMLFDISLGMARRLLMKGNEGDVVCLEELAEKIGFEIAVGRNGKVWVKSEGIRETLIVGRALVESDKRRLSVEEQRSLVKQLLRGT